jgi:hypothetical protein
MYVIIVCQNLHACVNSFGAYDNFCAHNTTIKDKFTLKSKYVKSESCMLKKSSWNCRGKLVMY